MYPRDYPCMKCGQVIASTDAQGVYTTTDRIWTVSFQHEVAIDGAVTVLKAEVVRMYCEACAAAFDFRRIVVPEVDWTAPNKNVAVIVYGLSRDAEIKEFELHPGVRVRDLLLALELPPDYRLSREGSGQELSSEDDIHVLIESGEKLRAAPVPHIT